MKKVFLKLFVLFVLTGMMNIASVAEPKENSHLWETKVTSVTVFKNGMGFYLRQGDVTLRDGWCVSDAVPPAAFGTLAIFPYDKNEFVDIIGAGSGEIVEFDGVDAPKDLVTKRTRLEACKYLKVELSYRYHETDRTAAGKLVAVNSDYAVLEADNTSFAVPIESINKLQILEKPLRIHVSSDNAKMKALNKKSTLGMAYLRKGITWIPEYSLELIDDETAELTLRGTLVNEAEDLIHCDVNFVVGVPHFIHSDYLAPIAVGQTIRTIGAAVAPAPIASQIMNRAGIAADVKRDKFGIVERTVDIDSPNMGKATGNLPQWEGTGATDFAVYVCKDLTVRTGEKAIVTLFTKRIKYSHIYHWNIPGEITHSLVLKNETDTPWTTGPCLAISDNNALSEDLLKYVPKGGSGEFPITTAVNISHDEKESEVERKLKAYEPSRDFFVDMVILEGELKLHNLSNIPIQLDVNLPVQGKPTTASYDGNIILHSDNLKLLERSGNISWHLQLKPGEAKSLSYQYERYVPSR